VCAHGGGSAPAARWRVLPASAASLCRALVSLRLSWGPSPFAFMHLLLCSRTLGLSDGLSASNNVQLYSCSPLLPLLSFTLTFFKPPSQPTLPAASTSHCGTTHFAARASVDCHHQ
jgi:hypothetical protein